MQSRSQSDTKKSCLSECGVTMLREKASFVIRYSACKKKWGLPSWPFFCLGHVAKDAIKKEDKKVRGKLDMSGFSFGFFAREFMFPSEHFALDSPTLLYIVRGFAA